MYCVHALCWECMLWWHRALHMCTCPIDASYVYYYWVDQSHHWHHSLVCFHFSFCVVHFLNVCVLHIYACKGTWFTSWPTSWFKYSMHLFYLHQIYKYVYISAVTSMVSSTMTLTSKLATTNTCPPACACPLLLTHPCSPACPPLTFPSLLSPDHLCEPACMPTPACLPAHVHLLLLTHPCLLHTCYDNAQCPMCSVLLCAAACILYMP